MPASAKLFVGSGKKDPGAGSFLVTVSDLAQEGFAPKEWTI